MLLFRLFLALAWLAIVSYTAAVGLHHGFDLLPIFFGDMLAFTWPGQFNLDFMILLTLSGLWAAWRGGFSGKSIALGVFLSLAGALALLPYLFYLSYQTQGDTKHPVRHILMGNRE